MDKIVGFTLSKNEIEHSDIDFFNVELSLEKGKLLDYNFYYWGIGKVECCKIDDKYSLSFPLNLSLDDKNILIYIEDGKLIIENDWLGSIPVFYNEKEQIVSTLMNKTIRSNREFNPEGFNNFLEFGYSILGQTPLEDVKFMRYNSKLIISNMSVDIFYKNDVFSEEKMTEEEIVNSISDYLNNKNYNTILPLSGGYDSRLLASLIKNKDNMQCFTYGISDNQEESYEVQNAKKISEILNLNWEQIQLEEFHKYINDWFKIFSCSTHLHGMYHIEFYSKILEKVNKKNSVFLSGIVGDAWAGSIEYIKITTSSEINKLGYTHGLIADIKQSKLKVDKKTIADRWFNENINSINNEKFQVIQIIRFKIILLSYLITIPEYFGFPVITPYLNKRIVLGMINLEKDRRKNRVWQKEFFIKKGLNIEDMKIKKSTQNSLDMQILKKSGVDTIKIEKIEKYIEKHYLLTINNVLRNRKIDLNWGINYLLRIPKVGGLMRRIGVKDRKNTSYNSYLTIKALEKIKNE
ncbi:MAG: hypothetical protein JW924_09345 [Fusobacteriaceae bacterium]|nr:hypothetical protein [Fusobacteriaceae bacterium]